MLAEQLVGEARARHPRGMDARERRVLGISAALFLVAAIAIAALLPSEREFQPLLLVGLVAGYALISRVRFEVGNWFVVPESLVFVPLVLLAPLPYVPLLVAWRRCCPCCPSSSTAAGTASERSPASATAGSPSAPVLALAWLAPGEPSLAHFGAYVAAFGAQFGFDLAWTILRDRLIDQIPYRTIIDGFIGTFRFDAILTPIAFVITLPAVEEPLILLTIGPLVWLLETLSRDRRERYTATLELQRAYRGTVMLLSDVVEFDDKYTADHSRSVVDLTHATADELGIDPAQRQELEFAALLHDVGKIAIPKEILNKPSALTASEFEVMKTHTIEGQFMLDRVGGLLARVGEIVRSCHERWDGSGYPDGLTGEEIPLESRIVFAADAYNAMTTDRPYRGALSQQQAINELRAGSGTQFDPRVIEALCVAVATTDPSSNPAADEVRALLVHSSVADRLGARA